MRGSHKSGRQDIDVAARGLQELLAVRFHALVDGLEPGLRGRERIES